MAARAERLWSGGGAERLTAQYGKKHINLVFRLLIRTFAADSGNAGALAGTPGRRGWPRSRAKQ